MDNLSIAKEYLQKGYSVCVYKNGEALLSKGRGISFVAFLARDNADVKGASVADKIVGTAAARIFILLGVKEIYAEVLSSEAARILTEKGISVTYGTLVNRIVNRLGTGLCPMEEAVEGISDDKEALSAVLDKLERLKQEKIDKNQSEAL